MIGSVIAILVLTGVGMVLSIVIAICSCTARRENPCCGHSLYETPTVNVEIKQDTPPLPSSQVQGTGASPRAPFKNTDLPFGFLVPNGLIEGTFDCILPPGDL